MKAIVLADRLGHELQPLVNHYCVALLPVAGKPLIEYTLEELADAGIQDVMVVISDEADHVERVVGDGSRWGLSVEYFLSRGEESPQRLLQRIGEQQGPCIMLRGDVFRSRMVETFLSRDVEQREHFLEGRDSNGCTAMVAFNKPGNFLACMAWPQEQVHSPVKEGMLSVMMGSVALLDNIQDYHQANLDAVAGKFDGTVLPGKESQPGLFVGARTAVDHLLWSEVNAVVGEQTQIHPSVSVDGQVVIGDSVVVEEQTTIVDSIVFPGTYVGADLDIRNAIITSKELIRVDTGAIVNIDDPLIISDLHQNKANDLMHWIGQRCCGLLLLVLSLPLWIVAAVMAVVCAGPDKLGRTSMVSNRKAADERGEMKPQMYEDWFWNVRSPVLRRLPRILAVIRGDLDLIGCAPRSAPREGDSNDVTYGLFGPVQIELSSDAPAEECQLAEIYYQATRNMKQDFTLLILAMVRLLRVDSWKGV